MGTAGSRRRWLPDPRLWIVASIMLASRQLGFALAPLLRSRGPLGVLIPPAQMPPESLLRNHPPPVAALPHSRASRASRKSSGTAGNNSRGSGRPASIPSTVAGNINATGGHGSAVRCCLVLLMAGVRWWSWCFDTKVVGVLLSRNEPRQTNNSLTGKLSVWVRWADKQCCRGVFCRGVGEILIGGYHSASL